MQKSFFVIGIFVALIITVSILLRGDEDTWICKNGQWVKHGNPENPAPEKGCGKEKVSLESSDKINLMKFTSPAFEENSKIPTKYTCDGENVNPPLTFSDTPEETKSLVLIVSDSDAPNGNWIHWILFNIPPETKKINEDEVPEGVIEGKNSFGDTGYGGPCPPSGSHRYVFKLYALDTTLALEGGETESEVSKEIEAHLIKSSDITGLYR